MKKVVLQNCNGRICLLGGDNVQFVMSLIGLGFLSGLTVYFFGRLLRSVTDIVDD
jgi:hypothetical protein